MQGYACCSCMKAKPEWEVPKYKTNYGDFCSNECLEDIISVVFGVSIIVGGKKEEVEDGLL
jgi:hypothetical protein